MGLTLWRWVAGVTVGCGALAAALLPFPESVAERWTAAAPEPLAGEVRRFTADVGRTQAALRAYRAATGLALWRSAVEHSDTMSVRIDQSVPRAIADGVRDVAAEQWRALGPASAANAQIFVYVDSTTVPRATTTATSRRPLEPRRFVDVSFVLPQATDGSRCVALVRLGGATPAHVDALRRQSLVGVCGFFAAFGLPGAGVRQWLEATDYRSARRSDWHVALAPAIDASAVYGIGAAGGRCLTGEPGACLDVLGAGQPDTYGRGVTSASPTFVLDGLATVNPGDRARSRSELGNVEVELLMSAVREFGAERFGRFWRSETVPDAAFGSAHGVTLDTWTRQWLTRTFGALPSRPTVRLSYVVWVALAAPLLLVVAARPRERVLCEGWPSRDR